MSSRATQTALLARFDRVEGCSPRAEAQPARRRFHDLVLSGWLVEDERVGGGPA